MHLSQGSGECWAWAGRGAGLPCSQAGEAQLAGTCLVQGRKGPPRCSAGSTEQAGSRVCQPALPGRAPREGRRPKTGHPAGMAMCRQPPHEAAPRSHKPATDHIGVCVATSAAVGQISIAKQQPAATAPLPPPPLPPLPPHTHLFLELHVDKVRLRAVALPVRVLPPIPKQLHPVARLCTRHAPHCHVPNLPGPCVRLQHGHHCDGARVEHSREKRRRRWKWPDGRAGAPSAPFVVI